MFPTFPPISKPDDKYTWVAWPRDADARRSQLRNLQLERAFSFRWFCLPPFTEAGRQYAAYCGAPMGVRCSCGAQIVDHDPGDEDPSSP